MAGIEATASGSTISFAIVGNTFGPSPEVVITQKDFAAIAQARRCLVESTSFEEKFYAVCEYYRDIERHAFDAALNHMLYTEASAAQRHHTAFQFGRLVAAFLAGARLYTETAYGGLRDASGNALKEATVRAVASGQYDNSFYYRFMEELRNYVQHNEFPVQLYRYGTKTVDGLQHFSSRFFFTLDEENSSRIKAKVRRELAASHREVDLRQAARSYFSSLCTMHAEYQRLLKPFCDESEKLLKSWLHRWKSEVPATTTVFGVDAIQRDGETVRKTVHLELQSDIYRAWLLSKIQSVMTMGMRRVVLYPESKGE